MKILITTDLFTTSTNGVVTSVKNLWSELVKKGHEVRILTLSENRHSYQKDHVSYIASVPIGVYPDVRMPLNYRHRYLKELIEWGPDIIHSQCEFFTLRFACYISKKTKAPIVHTYHTLYEQYVTYIFPSQRLGKHIVSGLSRMLLKRIDRVIVPTRKVEDALLGYGLKNPISVVPSGISLEQHKRRLPKDVRDQKRAALGIDADCLVLLNLGRLGTEKNLDELVRFYAKAIEKAPNTRFLIVGDGPAKVQLEKLAASLELSDRVIFTGMVKPSEVQEYYQLGDLFVSASTSETQGLTYVEAAANGLPLLCRQDLCLKDVIVQGENGYEYTCEEEFLSHLERIQNDAAWCNRAGKCSEQIAEAFGKSAFGEKVERVYREVLHIEERVEQSV